FVVVSRFCLLSGCLYYVRFFFFFQAEDGIRDDLVTGVQTCALPILSEVARAASREARAARATSLTAARNASIVESDSSPMLAIRSEERRVGKECRDRWAGAA